MNTFACSPGFKETGSGENTASKLRAYSLFFGFIYKNSFVDENE